MFQLKLFSLWQGTIKASQGLPFHCPEIPWIPQGDVSGPPVQIEVLPCPESRTSNKINPKPTELMFCFHCLLKRATRFGRQTPRLFPKKAFDFHLSAENARAAAAVLRLQTQRPRPARRMAITSLLSDKSIKPRQNQAPWVTLQQPVCKHRHGSVSHVGAEAQRCNIKNTEAQGREKAAQNQEMHANFHRNCSVHSTPSWSRKVENDF